jgi:hypothetical protein
VRKTHLMVLAIVVAAVVLAVGAVAAFADINSDSEKPVTTTNAAASYWDAAAITVTATDNVGVRYIYHKLDGQPVRLDSVNDSPKSYEIPVPTAKDQALAPGSHTLKFWAQDVNGNVEAQQSLEFTIVKDTAKPRTSATSASVRRGRMATLKYKVADAEPTKGTATVKIKIKNSHGKFVKTIRTGSKAVNTDLKARFRCKLAKGAYRFYVYATDASGNVQAKVGSAGLKVK